MASSDAEATPWYRRCVRWGQTNLVEIDPLRYDDAFWRRYWDETRIHGVIVNAGGIVTHYPSALPLRRCAFGIEQGIDLFGRISESARQSGLALVARMDSNRVHEEFAEAHPDWLAVSERGEPYRAGDGYVMCLNSPYYIEFLPSVLAEVIDNYHPDGFADNNWAGLEREFICFCRHCTTGFGEYADTELPKTHDWDDDTYRTWIAWNYELRTQRWVDNNTITRTHGGDDCLWTGMLSGDLLRNSQRFIDLRSVATNAPFVMLDHQFRPPGQGFHQNSEAGKRIHELAGWDVLIPESMPMYAFGVPPFRLSAMPTAEARLWAAHAFAGGIQPWWHHIGSEHDDKRQYDTAAPIFRWHDDNESVLLDRRPLADVGVVWSQVSTDYVGREHPDDRILSPYRGFVRALVTAGIPYVPIHADDIPHDPNRFRVVVLPNVAALSDAQCDALENYMRSGGSVIATGETAMFDEWGRRREVDRLGDLLGATRNEQSHGDWTGENDDAEFAPRHTYMRLRPTAIGEAEATASRHPVLDGFEKTGILPFGGLLLGATLHDDVHVPLTYIPHFPIYPPEAAWMRGGESGLPCLVLRTSATGRSALLLADIDRCADRERQPDHLHLLASIVKWARGPKPTFEAVTSGDVSLDVYTQGDRVIVHLSNEIATSTMPARQARVIKSAPVEFSLALRGTRVATAHARVASSAIDTSQTSDRFTVRVEAIDDHQVVVVDYE